MPFFSIIIPTYNSSSTIGECLESILDQSFSDFEILIMDGLSIDDTLSIVESYSDQRIKIFSEKDQGVYDAMNKGVDQAAGNWLYFIGSDDTLYNKEVFQMIALEVEKESFDLIYGNAYFLKQEVFYDGEFDRQKLFLVTNICHQAIFYNKNIFARLGGYNLKFPIYSDWDFNIRCFSTPNLRIKYIDQTVANYNDFGGISNSRERDYEFEILSGYAQNEMIKYLKLLIERKEEEKQGIANSKDFKLGSCILNIFRKFRK